MADHSFPPFNFVDYDAQITTDQERRRMAVVAALEVVRAAALGSGESKNVNLNMQRLGDFADIIQAALEPSKGSSSSDT